jgi:hypothetical protein
MSNANVILKMTDCFIRVDSFSELWDFAAVELFTVLKQDLDGEALNVCSVS